MAEWICGEKTSPLGYKYLDVVHRKELIRCKDCKHYNKERKWCNYLSEMYDQGEEWFCADGERRE